jgi:diaminopimelate decarboxylase
LQASFYRVVASNHPNWKTHLVQILILFLVPTQQPPLNESTLIMIGYHYKNKTLHVDDIPLTSLAQKFGTPLYIYSAAVMRDRFHALQNALNTAWPETSQAQKPWLAYACKANSNLAVINLFARLGGGVDIVSGGELKRALAAGVAPDKIIFSGVGKTKSEMELALNTGIHQLNIESEPEYESLKEVASRLNKKMDVALRFTPQVVAHTHEKISTGEDMHKFGMLEDEIYRIANDIKTNPTLNLCAISIHIGSYIPSLEPFRQAFEKTSQLIQKLQSQGHTMTRVDLGGGLWAPYQDEPPPNFDDYARMIADLFAPLNVTVALEPGRILVAEAGCLLSEVIFVKKRPHKKFVIIDAAMNDLIRPTLYDAYHPIKAVEQTDRADEIVDIVGPVCETGDYLALDRTLPIVQEKDLLAILMAGAYGTVMSSNYNARGFTAEILVDGSEAHVIRERQKTEDIWSLEKIPS